MAGMLGIIALATAGRDGWRVLAEDHNVRWKEGGGILDFSGVTAEATDRTLSSGRLVKAGDKVIEAGNVLYRTGGGKFAIALTATTLTRGDCFVIDRDAVLSDPGSEQTGSLFDEGTVWYSRLKLGGALASPTNFLAAFPGITLIRD